MVLLNSILISSFILLGAVLLLGFRIFFIKGGKFPNTHIGGSKALRNKGIACATTQDRESRKPNLNSIKITEVINDLGKNY